MAKADDIRVKYHKRLGQASDRLRRAHRVRDILAGRFDMRFRDLVGPGDEPAVANLIAAAARTMAQRVGMVPRIHAVSDKGSDTAKKRAEKHEKAIAQRMDDMRLEHLLPQGAYWLVCHGLLPMMLRWDTKMQQAVIDIRDPMTCFPDTVWPHRTDLQDCLFMTDMEAHQVESMYPDVGNYFSRLKEEEFFETVKIAEYHTPEGIYICAVEPRAVPLDYIPSALPSQVAVWVARDFTPDMDFYGQFDQVVPILVAQAKLMSLVMIYAEQQVFSPTWVVGDIVSNGGDWAYGPNAVNQIAPAPSAGVGTVTNNMSGQVFSELDRLERAIRVSGGFPAQLSGESVASIATGRGIEQLNASVDDNISHYQKILAASLRPMLDALPAFERAHGKDDVRFSDDVKMFPRFQAGNDPAASVRLLQLVGSKVISRGRAMDELPEVDDTQKEQAHIEVEALRDALIGNIIAQAGQGAADPNLVQALIQGRLSGTSMEDAYQKYQEGVQAAAAQQGPPGVPGAPPGPPGLPTAPGQPGAPKPALDALLGMSVAGKPYAGVTGRVPIK